MNKKVILDITEQNRTEQNRTEQNRTEQKILELMNKTVPLSRLFLHYLEKRHPKRYADIIQ